MSWQEYSASHSGLDKGTSKETEEEENGCISHRNTFRIADDVIVVSDGAVRLNLSKCGVIAIPDSAITLHLSQIRVVGVPHLTVTANLSQETVITVSYITITIDPRHHRIIAVSDSTISINLRQHRVVGIAYCLCWTHHSTEQQQYHKYNNSIHSFCTIQLGSKQYLIAINRILDSFISTINVPYRLSHMTLPHHQKTARHLNLL